MDLGVGGDGREGGAAGGDLLDGVVYAVGGDVGVERDGGGAQAVEDEDLALVGAAGAVGEVLAILGAAFQDVVAVDVLQLLQQGPLDLILDG